MIEKIFILENPKIEGIENEKKKIEELLKSCGKIVENSPENADLIITLGGDGTILKAIHLLKNEKMLIYGIKYGKIGFLTNSPENVETKIKNILSGKYRVERKTLFELYIKKNGDLFVDRVLNDFLIYRRGIRIVDIEIFCNEEKIMEFRGDGVIISTSTGSTAHSLSAGGPIIEPNLECLLIIPICPYTLSIRPVILSSEKSIKIKVLQGGKIIADGQREYNFEGEEICEIRKSRIKVNLILEEDFFKKLKTKFNFGK